MIGSVSWRSLYFNGTEQATFKIDDTGLHAQSVISWQDERQQERHTQYEVICGVDWATKNITISQDDRHSKLVLSSDGKGNWHDSNNRELRELTGCIDVDFQATPFTNLLPIRRLPAKANQRYRIRVVYITFPELELYPVEQFYTRLHNKEWLFEQPEDNFSAKIPVDNIGLVIDYPGLFKRT